MSKGFILIAALLISAGIHLGLAPEHLAEMPKLGRLFILDAVLLTLVAALVTRGERGSIQLAAILLALNVAALILAWTTGIPGVVPKEQVEWIAEVTLAIEAAGLVAAIA